MNMMFDGSVRGKKCLEGVPFVVGETEGSCNMGKL